jgi:hypothetical protein
MQPCLTPLTSPAAQPIVIATASVLLIAYPKRLMVAFCVINMSHDGNLERDDSTYFARTFQFLPFVCLYSIIGLYSVVKLAKNWSNFSPIIRLVFSNVSGFFLLRTCYWLDFVFAYPSVVYFYLELLPYFWLISICSMLVFSWLKVTTQFLYRHPSRKICWLGLTVISLNALMLVMFTLLYFINWYYHRSILMLVARCQNNFWLVVGISTLMYSGRKLIKIVDVYLSTTYGQRLRAMMYTAVLCLMLRLVINTFLLVFSRELDIWKRADNGISHSAFSIMDYLVTEVAFLFFLTYAIQVHVQKATPADSEDSNVSQGGAAEALGGPFMRLLTFSSDV